MLSGSLTGPMLMFALPLIATGVMQQSFTSVDVAVVGRFAGSDALAAVGSCGPVIGLLLNMFIGLAVGVNVVIANNIGQRNGRGVRDAVSASAVLALVCGAIMLVVSQLIARPILEALNTPVSCLDQAVEYLRVFALGIPFIIIYNFGAAVLRSIGDTRRPFYVLIVSGLINIVLNLIFVIIFKMGVVGVAWATTISNIVNALCIIVMLVKEEGDIHLDLHHMRLCLPQMSRICRIGIPAGVQSTVFSISNVFILSAINGFGAAAAAGSAAALNYEFYCYFVINAFGQTSVAFISQNYGAGQLDRCRKIFRLSLIYSTISCGLLNILLAWRAEFFAMAFTTDAEVLVYAVVRMTTVLVFQWIACYYEMAGSAMRGLGHSLSPAMITIFGTCVLRLLWVAFFPAQGASFAQLMLVYPVSWTVTDVLMALAFMRVRRQITIASDDYASARPAPQIHP